jgi:hypothetical protein
MPVIAWYHAGIAPGWELALKRIGARIQAFIWKGSIPKVAKATLRLPKNERRLLVWSLVDKARVFTSIWVVKYLLGMTNPVLQSQLVHQIQRDYRPYLGVLHKPFP